METVCGWLSEYPGAVATSIPSWLVSQLRMKAPPLSLAIGAGPVPRNRLAVGIGLPVIASITETGHCWMVAI